MVGKGTAECGLERGGLVYKKGGTWGDGGQQFKLAGGGSAIEGEKLGSGHRQVEKKAAADLDEAVGASRGSCGKA